ncbi:MAG: tRNA pseudouridine synthase A [Crocinitomicaceae bacterium]
MKKTYYYLIHIQYLGFRFSGWQKQPNQKTIHLMIDKTVQFVLKHDRFKTMGASRTDAKVSANHGLFELFVEFPINVESFLTDFNSNLSSDIRATKMEEVNKDFNIINSSKTKTYHYFFTCGPKPHPFSASLVAYFKGDLDVELMKKGAKLFEGTHNFKTYCTKPKPNTTLTRHVGRCEIMENDIYTANFFPDHSWVLVIESKGFLRNQVRLIMGQLIRLGRGEINLDYIRKTLAPDSEEVMDEIAPGSGLQLHRIDYDIITS